MRAGRRQASSQASCPSVVVSTPSAAPEQPAPCCLHALAHHFLAAQLDRAALPAVTCDRPSRRRRNPRCAQHSLASAATFAVSPSQVAQPSNHQRTHVLVNQASRTGSTGSLACKGLCALLRIIYPASARCRLDATSKPISARLLPQHSPGPVLPRATSRTTPALLARSAGPLQS